MNAFHLRHKQFLPRLLLAIILFNFIFETPKTENDKLIKIENCIRNHSRLSKKKIPFDAFLAENSSKFKNFFGPQLPDKYKNRFIPIRLSRQTNKWQKCNLFNNYARIMSKSNRYLNENKMQTTAL